jgi:hypothetical protein
MRGHVHFGCVDWKEGAHARLPYRSQQLHLQTTTCLSVVATVAVSRQHTADHLLRLDNRVELSVGHILSKWWHTIVDRMLSGCRYTPQQSEHTISRRIHPGNPCSQPQLAGSGQQTITRWFFNPQTGRCETFLFRGLQGNQNNFVSYDQCATSCASGWSGLDMVPTVITPYSKPVWQQPASVPNVGHIDDVHEWFDIDLSEQLLLSRWTGRVEQCMLSRHRQRVRTANCARCRRCPNTTMGVQHQHATV